MLLGLFELWNLKRQVDTVNNKILKRMVDISAYSKVNSIDFDIFCQLTHATTDRCQTSEMKMSKLFAASANVWQGMQFLCEMEIWGLLSCSAHTVTADKDPRALFDMGKDLKNCTYQPSISFASVDFQPVAYHLLLNIVNSFKMYR